MHKKIITLFLIFAFFTFNTNVKIEAAFPTETFQVNFTAVVQGPTPQPRYYEFVSECIVIPFEVNVLSIQSLTDPNSLLNTAYLSPNALLVSSIDYFVNSNCTTNNNFSQSEQDRLFNSNNNLGLLGDKPYVFNIGNIGNFYNVQNFTPQRSRSLIVRFASNLTLNDLINFSVGGAPFEDMVSVNTFFSFQIPNIVRYVDGFTSQDRYFISILPINPTPTRTNYTFQYWRDSNGERQFGQTSVNNPSLIAANGVYTLYSYYTRDVVAGDPILDTTLGGVLDPLDTILFNTGFLNNGGVMFIYFILVVSLSFLAYTLKLSSLISIITNILLTAIFLILGYLPLFTSVLLITFYIIALISINKGGFLNE
jgi:hypothetical protein